MSNRKKFLPGRVWAITHYDKLKANFSSTRHTNLLPPSILSMNSTQLNKVLTLLQVIIEEIDLWNCFVKVDVLSLFSSCLRKREASLNCCRSFIMNPSLMEWQLRIFFVFSWLTKHCRIMRYLVVFYLTAKLTHSPLIR